MSKPSIDLSKLALERQPAGDTSKIVQKKRWVIRYFLPFAILLGFTTLLVAAAGSHLFPSRAVTVVPVIAKRAAVVQEGTSLFQAPGWIEPRPTAINVSAMTPGVVEDLLVVAGQRVQEGDCIAWLIAVDAELALKQAKANLAIRLGEANRAKAELAAARVRFENPVHLRVRLADAQSSLKKVETELGKLPFLIEAAESTVEFAQSSLNRKQRAGKAVTEDVMAEAISHHAVAAANLKELKERKPNLEREVKALAAVVDAIESQLSLLVEETRQLGEAEAKLQAAEAYRDEAQLKVQQAELALDRCIVRAPIAGRILRLVAAPGSRVMGLETSAHQSSATVVEMYDPESLQVRVDVRLEDVPLVTQGQRVEISTASSSTTLQGEVLQVTSSANIQKNTLEVKVSLLSPPATVSPEMLVTATFLAPKDDKSADADKEQMRLFVPRSLVETTAEGSHVWIVDSDMLARKRTIQLENSGDAEFVVVKSGLVVTDKLVTSGLEGLREGTKLRVTGDDPRIGMN